MRRNATYSLLCRVANCDNDIISAIYNCKSYSINPIVIEGKKILTNCINCID